MSAVSVGVVVGTGVNVARGCVNVAGADTGVNVAGLA
jgi:hypothetical protein